MRIDEIKETLLNAKHEMENRKYPTVLSTDVLVLYSMMLELVEHVEAQEPEPITEADVLEYHEEQKHLEENVAVGNAVRKIIDTVRK